MQTSLCRPVVQSLSHNEARLGRLTTLAHQGGRRPALRIVPCRKAFDDAAAILGRAILAEFELTLHSLRHELESHDCLQTSVNERAGVVHAPKLAYAVLKDPRGDPQDLQRAGVVYNTRPAADVHDGVVPGWNASVRVLIPGGDT